jgi:hypothetical protein
MEGSKPCKEMLQASLNIRTFLKNIFLKEPDAP